MAEQKQEVDLFGNPVIKDSLLRDKFIEPPFTVLDTKTGSWRNRSKQWKRIGIRSEVGRDVEVLKLGEKYDNQFKMTPTSIFDPALCEVLYHWFCPAGGKVLDPFAGGSVRGIVANYLGFKYTGVDIRQEQIDSNMEQAIEILEPGNYPEWIVGDSAKVVPEMDDNKFDYIMSCPPYADLEVYSDLEGDISNMKYPDFMVAYTQIIKESAKKLKPGCLATFVVGEVRNKKGHYYGFVPDTIKAFEEAGLKFYNEAILLNAIISAAFRAANCMKKKKLVKVHQNVLTFIKE